MSDLVQFQFHGDEIDVIPEEGEAWISVRRVCESLGIAFSPQRTKLANDDSISKTLIVTQVEDDDQSREIFCISVRSLPLWLATIHPSKVSDAAREKLVAYKREAAEVLADHFLGRRARHDNLDGGVALLRDEVAQLRAGLASAGMITGLQQDHIRTKVALFAHRKVALGQEATVKAASARIQNMIHAAAGWGQDGSAPPIHARGELSARLRRPPRPRRRARSRRAPTPPRHARAARAERAFPVIVPERDEREPASARAVESELVGVTWGDEASRAADRRHPIFPGAPVAPRTASTNRTRRSDT